MGERLAEPSQCSSERDRRRRGSPPIARGMTIMRVGIVGAGKIGSTLAKLWTSAGHAVLLSSRHPQDIQPLVASLGARASSGTPADAATFGEVLVFAVPLKAIPGLARDLASIMKGKVVLDAGNAYEARDGQFARDAVAHPGGSAGWAAALFSGARWVKGFNTVNFRTLDSAAHRDQEPLGIPLAGDNKQALDVVAQLARDAGFDPVIVGPLARGKEFEPNTAAYNSNMTGRALRQLWSTNQVRTD